MRPTLAAKLAAILALLAAPVLSAAQTVKEVIQLQRLANGGTRGVSMRVGWGTGAEWDKAIAFFAKGNEGSYKNLAKCVGPLER